MRRLVMLVLIMLLFPAGIADARSVHSTDSLDMFPQGDMEDSSKWEFKRHRAFTSETAPEDGQYVSGIVADNHMTMGISLPEHLDIQTIWANSTPTNSNASLGAPDGAYHYSTGPDITLSGFDVSAINSNLIESVELVVHFDIPDALLQDKTRFSVINGGIHDLVKTWSNTQGGLYYMNNGWSVEIFDSENWTWDELSNLEINLDYVSNGGTDDSQLQVDAVGLKVTMRTPWWGAERVVANSINQFTEWPIIDLDFSEGQLESVSTAPCGLDSDGGTWITEIIEKPPSQSWGRIHFTHSDENGSITLDYKNNQGAWTGIASGTIPVVSGDLELRFTITDTCLTKAWIDINDPHVRVQGSILGDVDAMEESSTRWTLVVNGKTVANNDATMLGSFDYHIPIGHTLDSSDNSIGIEIKVWYNWDNDGSPASVSLRINSLEIIGAYSIEYDEDPECSMIGSHDLTEDGGGIILPLLSRCSDDRTSVDDLSVTFDNNNPDLLEVDLTEGQVRIKLLPESSGTAQIVITVTDTSGNFWREVSTINVANVDDKPVLEEFTTVHPVDHGFTDNISFSLSDADTFNQDLVVTTNRSWATVDMENREILVNPPTPGFTSVLITACDETSCVDRVLELEVRALSELYIEEIRIEDDIRAGDIFEVKVFVRNSGQVSATLVEVRCSADGRTFGNGIIQILEAGQMGFVSCDMQAPYDDDSLIIEAEVDRAGDVEEVDEENNVKTEIIPIGDAIDEDSKSDSGIGIDVGQNGIYIGSALLLIIIIVIFVAVAPPKIKKLE